MFLLLHTQLQLCTSSHWFSFHISIHVSAAAHTTETLFLSTSVFFSHLYPCFFCCTHNCNSVPHHIGFLFTSLSMFLLLRTQLKPCSSAHRFSFHISIHVSSAAHTTATLYLITLVFFSHLYPCFCCCAHN